MFFFFQVLWLKITYAYFISFMLFMFYPSNPPSRKHFCEKEKKSLLTVYVFLLLSLSPNIFLLSHLQSYRLHVLKYEMK